MDYTVCRTLTLDSLMTVLHITGITFSSFVRQWPAMLFNSQVCLVKSSLGEFLPSWCVWDHWLCCQKCPNFWVVLYTYIYIYSVCLPYRFKTGIYVGTQTHRKHPVPSTSVKMDDNRITVIEKSAYCIDTDVIASVAPSYYLILELHELH